MFFVLIFFLIRKLSSHVKLLTCLLQSLVGVGAACFKSIPKMSTYPTTFSVCCIFSHHLAHCAAGQHWGGRDTVPLMGATLQHTAHNGIGVVVVEVSPRIPRLPW